MTPEDNTNTEQDATSVENTTNENLGQDNSNDSQFTSSTDDPASGSNNTQDDTAASTSQETTEPETSDDVSPVQESPSTDAPANEEVASNEPVNDGQSYATQQPEGTSPAESALETAAIAEAIPTMTQPDANQVVASSHGKSPMKMLLKVLVVIILIAAASFAAYTIGKNHAPKPVVASTSTTIKTISLPPSAIVTAACVPGRGKQYIIPKDIPEGPIYDVENNKVIAIEYVFGVHQILANSSLFSSTLLALSRDYPVDHFAFLPVAPQPGDTDQYVHLIMSVVSPKISDAITCQGVSSTSTSSTSTTPTTTPSATSKATN
ncbi:MAG TPA: hypothetical protein VIH90_00430 [Candidatus Saccharimonadales bacterium]